MSTYQVTTDKGVYQVDTDTQLPNAPNQTSTASNQANITPNDANNAPNQPPDVSNDLNQASSALNDLANPQNNEGNSPLNFVDMVKFNALGDPQEQKDFLKSKYKFVEPTGDNKSFMVGNDPSSLNNVNPDNIGNNVLMGLAKASNMILPVGGQIAGTIAGAPAGPAGMIAGAAGGAALGQGVENALTSQIPGSKMDLGKGSTDAVISGLFGAAGEGLGQAISIGAKNYLKPAITKALDGAVAKAQAQGKDLSAFVNTVGNIFKFTSGADKDKIAAGFNYGWNNIYGNPKNLEKGEIDNIGHDMNTAFVAKQKELGKKVDDATQSLLDKSKSYQINATPVINDTVDALDKMGIVKKTPFDEGEASPDGVTATFRFNDLPSTFPVKDMKLFLNKIGAQESSYEKGLYHIPETSSISVEDAVKAKNIFQHAFNNPNIDPQLGRIMKGALYGEGKTAEFPDGTMGLRTMLNGAAESAGNDAYLTANKNYSDLLKANENLKPYGFDANNPVNISNKLGNILEMHPIQQKLISNLDNMIGSDAVSRASQWQIAQHVSQLNPNYLRLSLVASMLGLVTPGDAEGKVEKVGLAFALASGGGIGRLLRYQEGVSGAGNSILKGLANQKSKSLVPAKAILSQLVANKAKQ